jgi:hypothetical protein
VSDEQTPTTSNAPAAPSGQQAQPTAEQVDIAQRPGETKAETAKRLWKLQVGGREEEVDDAGMLSALIEAHGEDGVRNIGQLSKAARRKMGELSHVEKELRAAADDLKDPRKAFALVERIHGKKAARAFMEEHYAGYLEEDAMAPEEREKRSLSREIEAMRREKEALENEKRERESATRTQQAQRQIGQQFRTALGEVGLDASPYVMARMAALAEAQMADGVPFDARELAREVAQEYEGGEVASLLKKLASNPEKLAKVLGPEGMRALRQHDIASVKAKQQPAPAQSSPRREEKQRERVPVDDFFAQLGKKF